MAFFGKYANNRKGRKNVFVGNERAVSLTPTVKEKSVRKVVKKVLPKRNE